MPSVQEQEIRRQQEIDRTIEDGPRLESGYAFPVPTRNSAQAFPAAPLTEDALNAALNNVWTSSVVNINYQQAYIREQIAAQPPTLPEPPWPIGTVLKWNTFMDGVISHLAVHAIDPNNAFFRIEEYDSFFRNTKTVRNFGSPVCTNHSYPFKYFLEATPEETEMFNQSIKDLNLCVERPSIGTVVKALLPGESINNKLAWVMGHSRENLIKITIISNNNVYTRSFQYFQIAKDQSNAFTVSQENYCYCAKCNSQHEKSQTKIIEDLYFCSHECVSEGGYERCQSCEKYHRSSSLTQTSCGKVCNECLSGRFSPCTDCNNLFITNSMYERRGLMYCGDCESSRGRVIRSYGYKPYPIYSKMLWENTRYLGIELEIETDDEDDREPLALKIRDYLSSIKSFNISKPLEKLIYMKNDGSLENGIEIVFHPFTLQSLHKNFPIRDFLQFLKDNNAEVSRRCGMHVHVSKEKLTTSQLIRGKWLFYKCAQFLMNFSGREDFEYCKFEGQPTNDPYQQKFGRRTALNVAGSLKTLEIRIFQSTLEYAKFMANIQFSDAFVDYIQHGAGTVFLKTHTPHQVWENFIDYCKRDGKYQLMTNYILRNAIV